MRCKKEKYHDKSALDHEAWEQWEARCLRCGRCCVEKIEYKGKIYLTDIPCEYLDPATNECTVYDQRSQIKDGCVAINREIIAMGVLPRGCAYVGNRNYDAPLSWENLPKKIRKNFRP